MAQGWHRKLERERTKRKEAEAKASSSAPIDVRKANYFGPDAEEGPHSSES